MKSKTGKRVIREFILRHDGLIERRAAGTKYEGDAKYVNNTEYPRDR